MLKRGLPPDHPGEILKEKMPPAKDAFRLTFFMSSLKYIAGIGAHSSLC